MSGELRVDVSYRGLLLVSGVSITHFGPTTAFVASPQPMPVGTELEVTAEGVGAFPARVDHVDELTEDTTIAGMRIRVSDLSDEAKTWWEEHVSNDDPDRLVDAAPPQAAAPEPEPEPEPEAAEPEPAPESEAVPEPVAANQTPQRTQVMSAVDLSQIEALANEAKDDDFSAREAEAAAAGVETEAPAADAAKGKKKRKKRSRRKKKDTSA